MKTMIKTRTGPRLQPGLWPRPRQTVEQNQDQKNQRNINEPEFCF